MLLNGLMLGSALATTAHYSMATPLLTFIAAHGPLEISMILMTSAAGLKVGWALVVAADRPRAELLQTAGRDSLIVLLGCMPWILLLGFVEGVHIAVATNFAGFQSRPRTIARSGVHPLGMESLLAPVAGMNNLDPASFRLLLDRVIEQARPHFRRLFLPTAVPLAACGMMATMLQIGWVKTLLGGDIGQLLPMVAGMFLLVVAILAVYGLGFGALCVASMDAVAGRPVAIGRAWLFVIKPAVFGTMIVVAVANFLSLILCVMPAFYVIPVLTFTLAVMIEEDLYGWAAIRRSAELAHYNPTGRWADSAWLQILVLLMVGTVINYVVSLTVQLPFVIAQQIIVFRDAASGQISGDPAELMASTLWLQAPAQVLGAFATAATWLYWTFGVSLLYREVRRRKEAGDLRRAIDELTGTADASPATV